MAGSKATFKQGVSVEVVKAPRLETPVVCEVCGKERTLMVHCESCGRGPSFEERE